jgi:hypothetical protein
MRAAHDLGVQVRQSCGRTTLLVTEGAAEMDKLWKWFLVALLIPLALAGCASTGSDSGTRDAPPAPAPTAPVTSPQPKALAGSATSAGANTGASVDKAWQIADRTHTEDAYLGFAKDHPDDPRAAKAKALAGRLGWLHAQSVGTTAAYQALLDKYPDDPHAAEARKMVGLVSSHVSGDNLQSVSLTVLRRVHRPLRISVPAGAYFVSGGSAQNMVACSDTIVDLTSDTSTEVSVPAACANFYRDQPDPSNSFSVRDAHPDPKLRKVLAVIDREGPDSTASQLAIWSITDNPSRSDVSGHITPAPETDDYRRAAKLLRDAGIRPSSREMFRDLR